jgi:hypothetical protein
MGQDFFLGPIYLFIILRIFRLKPPENRREHSKQFFRALFSARVFGPEFPLGLLFARISLAINI